MKKLKIALLMIVATVMVLPSCKKGENDPALSLKSRKARLCGEWELTEGTQTITSGGSTAMYTYNGSTCTYSAGGTTDSFVFTQEITIEKDGTYKIEIMADVNLFTEEGAWYFGGKNKELELKNKESVVFIETKEVSTVGGVSTTEMYSGANCPTTTYLLDELAGKEMIMILDGSTTGTSTSITTGTMTYEKK